MERFGFHSVDDVDIDNFFVDSDKKEKHEKEPERIQCPHCGEWFGA